MRHDRFTGPRKGFGALLEEEAWVRWSRLPPVGSHIHPEANGHGGRTCGRLGSESRDNQARSREKDDYYRQRFDVAHELGHLIMHHDAEPGGKVAEEQANRFAGGVPPPCGGDRSTLAELDRRTGIGAAC